MPADPAVKTTDQTSRRLQVKICGLTSEEAVDAAVGAGATHLGFVLAQSPRQITAERAHALAARVPEHVKTVAVFRHPAYSELASTLSVFDADLIQTEVNEMVLERFPANQLVPVLHDSAELIEVAMALFGVLGRPGPAVLEAEGRGGRGVRPDWARARTLSSTVHLLLAGGLTPDNVQEAVETVRPWGVDVSSGVEREPGVKDAHLIAKFIRAARSVGPGMITNA